jgi:hypothetical protein
MTPSCATFAHARPVEHVPISNAAEPQQGWPRAPHATQVIPASPPARQAPPAWQVLPAQQAWPLPPHASHVAGSRPPRSLQSRPALHVPAPPPGPAPPEQQGCPAPPHATHIIIEHVAPEAVHVAPPPLPQQA